MRLDRLLDGGIAGRYLGRPVIEPLDIEAQGRQRTLIVCLVPHHGRVHPRVDQGALRVGDSRRHRKVRHHDPAARSEHAPGFAQHPRLVGRMQQRLLAPPEIEPPVGEGKLVIVGPGEAHQMVEARRLGEVPSLRELTR